MAKSGFFIGTTINEQKNFYPVVYWSSQINDSRNGWVVKINVKYDCYELYLNPISAKLSLPISGEKVKEFTTLRIADPNTSRHQGVWITSKTFKIPKTDNIDILNPPRPEIRLDIPTIKNFKYKNINITACSAIGNIELEPITNITKCSIPTALTITKKNSGIGKIKKGDTIILSWNKSMNGAGGNNVTGYEIQYTIKGGPTGGYSWASLGTIPSSSSNKYSIEQTINFSSGTELIYRVKAIGTKAGYDSDWEFVNLSIANSKPEIVSVSCNTSSVPYNNGNGGMASFSWKGNDKDFDFLRYKYRISGGQWSDYTPNTAASLKVSGYPGEQIYLEVIANDGEEDSLPKISTNFTTIASAPGFPVITIVSAQGVKIDPGKQPPIVYYKLDSDVNFRKRTYEIILETSNSVSMYPVNSLKIGTTTNRMFILDLQNDSEISNFIKSNQYYRIKVRVTNGIDYSGYSYSGVLQKGSPPNYDPHLEIDYLEDNITKVKYIPNSNYSIWKLKDGRLRLGNRVNNVVALKWQNPPIPSSSSNPSYVEIYREITDKKNSGESSNWKLLAARPFYLEASFIDSTINESPGEKISYKLVFVNQDRWRQTDSDSYILTVYKNQPPEFKNTKNSLKILAKRLKYSNDIPIIEVKEKPNIVLSWNKTSTDSDDDYLAIRAMNGIESYINSPDSFDIKLIFEKDPYLSNLGNIEEGYPVDSNHKVIKKITLVENYRSTATEEFLNQYQLNDIIYQKFNNFSAESRQQIYSSVSIQITSKDTFEVESINNIIIPIILDFRSKPALPKNNNLNYLLKDKTNGVKISATGKDTTNPSAYTLDGKYMINSGETLEFTFPKITRISSYLLYYAISAEDAIENKEFILLKELPVANLIESGSNYIYSHIVSDYQVNQYVKFGISAKSEGVGRTDEDKKSTVLESDIIEFPFRLMICRATIPKIEINDIIFSNPATKDTSSIKVTFTINDLGGSKSLKNGEIVDSYWTYRNFERFPNNKIFKIEIYASETEDFSGRTPYTLSYLSGNDIKYPPEKGQKINNEKDFAYPWSNYTIDSIIGMLTLDPKKSWYCKLVLYVGHNSHSSKDSPYLGCFKVESQVFYLRALTPTLSVRKGKIGINTEPEYTLHISAVNNTKESIIQFDSGEPNSNKICFDLLTGMMTSGIIDCGFYY